MDPKTRDTWADALESGEYKQGTQCLMTRDVDDVPQHCCLGVLAELQGADMDKHGDMCWFRTDEGSMYKGR